VNVKFFVVFMIMIRNVGFPSPRVFAVTLYVIEAIHDNATGFFSLVYLGMSP
jgi:hypothetical protein